MQQLGSRAVLREGGGEGGGEGRGEGRGRGREGRSLRSRITENYTFRNVFKCVHFTCTCSYGNFTTVTFTHTLTHTLTVSLRNLGA